ncbi:hypothetical protein J1605_019560 [Eschrichtius robustus]|uniref:Uncharacterized protein n=1 Tax=Eschrichtius robustus TaxID=9764 RepID=A0AB34HPC8_ESCRO|nr:hypothetical protein J1605_019560 [Eschrichtius robustus]
MLWVARAERRSAVCVRHRHPRDHGCARGGPLPARPGEERPGSACLRLRRPGPVWHAQLLVLTIRCRGLGECSAARASDAGPSGASCEGPGGWLARRFRYWCGGHAVLLPLCQAGRFSVPPVESKVTM